MNCQETQQIKSLRAGIPGPSHVACTEVEQSDIICGSENRSARRLEVEQTLVLVKPDAVQRGLVGRIITRFEEKGLKLTGMKLMTLSNELLNEHYSHLADRPFFPGTVKFMQASPVVAICLEGIDAVATVRGLCGITKSREAAPGTIRGDWAMSIQANLVHASDSREAASNEVPRFFKAAELFDYHSPLTGAVYSEDELE